jgi:Glycosyl transferases group 1
LIYFLAPDEPRPSGGIRQIYLMVDLLCDLGYDATVFHGDPGFRCNWFENGTPVVARPFLRLESGDILVVPEYAGARARERCADAAVVIFNQNHFRTFINVGYEDHGESAYPGWPNAKAVLYTSEAIHRFLSVAVRGALPMHRTRVAVDTSAFVPREKRNLVALMRRKRHVEGEAVMQLVRRGNVGGWDVAPIEQMDQSTVARVLGEAAIFLSFSSEEGFGLPPAEAMAAGCYVVGYTGDGGREFMDASWCSPIDDQDIVAFAAEVARVMRQWNDDPDAVRRVAARGREFVTDTYTRENLRSDLAAAFSALTAPGSEALQTVPVDVTHWSVPVGPRGSLIRVGRQAVRKLGRRP